MCWVDQPGWYGERLALNIQEIRDNDRRGFLRIFCVFYEKHEPSKVAAAKALTAVLQHLSFSDIVKVDETMRQNTSLTWNIDWYKLKIESFFTPAMHVDERRAVTVFASFNPSGFTREQAVRMMAEYDGTLPYIFLRLNDWVPQVRQAAFEAFEKRLSCPSRGEILSALPYAEKFRRGNRGDHEQCTQKFFRTFVSPLHRDDLLQGLKSDRVQTRRICMYALLSTTPPDMDLAFAHLKSEPDPILRKTVFEKLHHLGKDMRVFAHTFLHDKFPSNRALALQCLDDAQEDNILGIAMQCLLDRNAMVRELARTIVLKNQPSFSFRAFYIEHIQSNTGVALSGLGETGQKSDTEIIEHYLHDERTAVVRASMVSLMKLDKARFSHEINRRLDNPGTGIVKTAQQLIVKYNAADYATIYEIFQRTAYDHTKNRCAAILFSAPKWNSILYMLGGLSSDLDIIRETAMHSIIRWLERFNCSFMEVSERQKASIRELLNQQKAIMPESIVKELLFMIQ